jgi:hypothetical protein
MKVFLHIGLPKVASTIRQWSLSQNIQLLGKENIIYPSLIKDNTWIDGVFSKNKSTD